MRAAGQQGLAVAARTRLEYHGERCTGTYTEYSDTSCVRPIFVNTWTGTAVVGDRVAGGARKLDLSFASYTGTPLTAAVAAVNNQYVYCGLTGWAPDVEENLLGRPCAGFAIPVGAKSLDIVDRERGTLRFGSAAPIAVNPTESERPTRVDGARVFLRQGHRRAP